jgi:hypothetical protein
MLNMQHRKATYRGTVIIKKLYPEKYKEAAFLYITVDNPLNKEKEIDIIRIIAKHSN